MLSDGVFCFLFPVQQTTSGIVCMYVCMYVFESLSRTVTCTVELLALICVIPRGKGLIPPCLGYYYIWYCTHWISCCLVVSSCPQVPYVLDAHDE